MGDYSNDLGFNNNGGSVTVTRSNEYSTNGDYSAKVLIPVNERGYVRCNMGNQSNRRGQPVTFSVDCKTNSKLQLELYEYYGGAYHHSANTFIPANANGVFAVSKQINEETTTVLIDISLSEYSDVETIFYTDNWRLIAP